MTKRILSNQDPATGRAVLKNQLALRVGGYSFLRSGRVPSVRGQRRIARQLNELRAALIGAVPNSDDPRVAALIGQVVRAEGFGMMLETYLKRYGILRLTKGGAVETMPALRDVIGFMNVERAAIAALGMDVKELEAIKAPYELVDEKDGSK
jgi:hypothetical protein